MFVLGIYCCVTCYPKTYCLKHNQISSHSFCSSGLTVGSAESSGSGSSRLKSESWLHQYLDSKSSHGLLMGGSSLAIGLRVPFPLWMLARGTLNFLSCGPLLRAADNMAAEFLRVNKSESERESVSKREVTVLYNLGSLK